MTDPVKSPAYVHAQLTVRLVYDVSECASLVDARNEIRVCLHAVVTDGMGNGTFSGDFLPITVESYIHDVMLEPEAP